MLPMMTRPPLGRRKTTSEKMAVPEKMLGSFQMETSEGFDEFMYELGVNVFTR